MRLREILLGLAVAGLVAGGVFWARGRTALPESSAPAGAELTDVTRADAVVRFDDLALTIGVEPRPAAAFTPHRWRLRAVRRGAPLPIEEGRLRFEMAMPMGEHRYTLVAAGDGWQEAEVILPSCPSGQRRWFANFEGSIGGVPRQARVQIDLAPAAARAEP